MAYLSVWSAMGKIVDTMESIPGFHRFEIGSKKLLVFRESQFIPKFNS